MEAVHASEGSDVVLGIDFGGTKIALATAAVGGEVRAARKIATDAPAGADQALERALAAARELIAETGGRCVAVGAVSPGIVEEGRVLLAPNVPGWDGLALPAALREGLGVEEV